MRGGRVVVLLASAVLVTGCSASEHEFSAFPPFTRVEVKGIKPVVYQLNDETKLTALRAIANRELKGWTQPFAGIPVGQVHLVLYGNDGLLGTLGVGSRDCKPGKQFLTIQRAGGFWSKSTSIETCRSFMAAL